MQFLLLIHEDRRPFSLAQLKHIFRSVRGFHSIRSDGPGGELIQAEFDAEDDSTIVQLSDDLESVALTGASGAALRAALLIQHYYGRPLRIFDLDYSFDLRLIDFRTVEELDAAIDKARAE